MRASSWRSKASLLSASPPAGSRTVTEGDGARRRRRSDRARDDTTEGAACRAVPEATTGQSSATVPAKARIRCHTDVSGGTKGAEGGRSAEEGGGAMVWRRRLLELLLRCEQEGELLQIEGWLPQRRGVDCAGGVAGGRAGGERLGVRPNIRHSANEERR